MIYTGNYKNCSSSKMFVSISGDKGKDAGYDGRYYLPLAPKKDFFKEWKENIKKRSEEENMLFYIENYYEKVLKNIDIDSLICNLEFPCIMGCYEDDDKFCHRYIAAAYLELIFGIDIPEVKVVDNKLIRLPKSEISKKVSNILYDVLVKDIDNEKCAKTKIMKNL